LLNVKQVLHQVNKRDPERTREAVLTAAEQLFADQGYDQTTLQQIGEAAGVSRGTPGYLFGSKEALYRAVLRRVVARVESAVEPALAELSRNDGHPEQAVRSFVGGFLAFLATEPNFVRLMQREALAGGEWLREALAAAPLDDALAALGPVVPGAAELLVALVGVCWFPVAHAKTLLAVLGLDPQDPEFRERYADEVAQLVRRARRA
jgi:AcrR family transcriptional regulator